MVFLLNEEKMMDFNNLMNLMDAAAPQPVKLVLMMLGGLVCLGYAYVLATPTEKDDAFLQGLEEKPVIGHLLRLLKRFSPLERKPKP